MYVVDIPERKKNVFFGGYDYIEFESGKDTIIWTLDEGKETYASSFFLVSSFSLSSTVVSSTI